MVLIKALKLYHAIHTTESDQEIILGDLRSQENARAEKPQSISVTPSAPWLTTSTVLVKKK